MSKTTGLGDNFYVGGYDLSGDVGSLDQITGSAQTLDVTTINQSAHSRVLGLRDGSMSFTSYFDSAVGAEHAALSTLPTADVIGMYLRGTTLLNPSACINAKQIDYAPTRGNDGSLTLKVQLQANAYGLEWGKQITAGLVTQATGTTSSAIDLGAGSVYGAQAYFMVTALSNTTNATITIQHATTSGGSYTTLMASSAFSAIGAQRVTVSNSTTVNEFLKIVTSGTFTNLTFAVVFVQNASAVVF
jgi:hypothetical protein